MIENAHYDVVEIFKTLVLECDGMDKPDCLWLVNRGSEVILNQEHSSDKLCSNFEHIALGFLPLKYLLKYIRIESNFNQFLQESVKHRNSTVDHMRWSHSLWAKPIFIEAVHAKGCAFQGKIYNAQAEAEPTLAKISSRSMRALGSHLALKFILELLMEFHYSDC